MLTLAEECKVINYAVPADQNSVGAMGSKSSALYLSMKGYDKITFIVTCGAMTEADTKIKAYQAKAAGTSVSASSISSTALTISKYWSDKSSVSSHAFAETTATSNQVPVTSTNNATYIFEIEGKQLNANSAYDCVGIIGTSMSAAATYAVTAILHKARYQRNAASMVSPMSN